jgi:ligand-binding SRPBCC domain-containing protein
MRTLLLEREQWLPAPPAAIFDFFADAANLEAITPPRLHFRILSPRPIEMRAGARIDYRLVLRLVPFHWVTRIAEWDPPRRFVDVQERGPYAYWHHTHEILPRQGGSLVRDVVRYALPFGVIGVVAHRLFIHRELDEIFAFRKRTLEKLLGGVETARNA